MSMNLTGNWTGFFLLDESYGPVLKGKKGFFELELTDSDGILSGKCSDVRGFGIKEIRNSIITGEIKNGWVSFVKKYDKEIPIDVFGSDVSEANYNSEVFYEGVPDHLGNIVKGNWKIKLKNNTFGTEESVTGKWEMKRKEI